MSNYFIKQQFMKEYAEKEFRRVSTNVFEKPDGERICFCLYEYKDDGVQVVISASSNSFTNPDQIKDRRTLTLPLMFNHANPEEAHAFYVDMGFSDGINIGFFLNKADWCEVYDCSSK